MFCQRINTLVRAQPQDVTLCVECLINVAPQMSGCYQAPPLELNPCTIITGWFRFCVCKNLLVLMYYTRTHMMMGDQNVNHGG